MTARRRPTPKPPLTDAEHAARIERCRNAQFGPTTEHEPSADEVLNGLVDDARTHRIEHAQAEAYRQRLAAEKAGGK